MYACCAYYFLEEARIDLGLEDSFCETKLEKLLWNVNVKVIASATLFSLMKLQALSSDPNETCLTVAEITRCLCSLRLKFRPGEPSPCADAEIYWDWQGFEFVLMLGEWKWMMAHLLQELPVSPRRTIQARPNALPSGGADSSLKVPMVNK